MNMNLTDNEFLTGFNACKSCSLDKGHLVEMNDLGSNPESKSWHTFECPLCGKREFAQV